MKTLARLAALSLTVVSLVSPARAHDDRYKDDDKFKDDERCKRVNGRAVWTIIPSNDPFGRILGPSTGDLKAAISAYITDFNPLPSGVINAKSVEVWVLGPQDIFIANGQATFTPIPGAPLGTVTDSLTLTLVGGTGKYLGATGTINVTGIGHDIFGPNAGPGKSFFEISYKGTVCRQR